MPVIETRSRVEQSMRVTQEQTVASPSVGRSEASIRCAYFLLCSGTLAALLLWFGRFLTLKGDLVAHFLLVDEIMKHGGVRAAPVPNLSAMALYPPGAHWMAAIIGWIGGSGLVGIVIVSIVSMYLLYLMIVKLVDEDSPRSMLAFAFIFVALVKTHSLIGWEINGNFFYPQLVGDVFLFASLIWLSRNAGAGRQAAFIIATGAIAMFVQPLVALHILGAGAMLITYEGLKRWWRTSRFPLKEVVAAAIIIIATMLLALYHPSFRAMRLIAEHNGEVYFGYSHPFLVTLVCGAIGILAMGRHFNGRTQYLDAVLGSAGLASACLMILQFIVLHMANEGSDYAVKKHMFIIVTLAAINVARLVASRLTFLHSKWSIGWIVHPLMAGLISALALQEFNVPSSPIVHELKYANHVAEYELPGFTPGDAADVDTTQSPFINLMVSMSAFQRPYTWFGSDLSQGVKYVMVRRSKGADANCTTRLAEGAEYVMVTPDCLKIYTPGEVLDFQAGGNGWKFAGSGWSMPEPWGVWSLGDSEVELSLPKTSKGPYDLSIDGIALIAPNHPVQKIVVQVNGEDIATWSFNAASQAGKRSAVIPTQLAETGSIKIVFKPINPVSPAQTDPTLTDTRVLGLGLKNLKVTGPSEQVVDQ
jgi:hypothetical protein